MENLNVKFKIILLSSILTAMMLLIGVLGIFQIKQG